MDALDRGSCPGDVAAVSSGSTPRDGPVATRRGLFAHAAAVAPAAVALAACGSQAPATPRASTARGPVLVQLGTGTTADVRQQRLKVLQDRQPTLQITGEVTPGNRYEKLTAALAAGAGAPDVFHFEPHQILELASKNLLVKLDSLVKRDRYDLDDFHAPTTEQYRWKGTLYSIPWPGIRALYVNLELFQRAGVPLPTVAWNQPAWTYEALVDAARRLTRPGEPPHFGFDWNTDYRGWGPIVFAHGGEVFSKDLRKVTVTEPRAIAGLQLLQDLRHKFRVAPTAEVYQQGQTTNAQLFKEGRTAIFFYWAAAIDEFRRDVGGFTFDARPMSRGPGGPVTSGGGQGWSIQNQSKAIDAAWEMLKYLGGRENMEAEMAAGITPPARKSLANSPAWNDPAKPPKNNRVFADGFAHIRVDPLLLNWTQVRAAMQAEVNKLINNQQPAGATATAIKQVVEPLLEENARLLGT